MIKEIRTIKYEALDGEQYDTPEAAMQASIAFKVEATHENWCNGDIDRDRDVVQFVVENAELLKAILAPEVSRIKEIIAEYHKACAPRSADVGLAESQALTWIIKILNGEL